VHRLADALAGPVTGHAGSAGGAHQANAGDLLLAARFVGDVPGRVALLGIEPEVVRTGIGLSPAVQAAIPAAVAAAHTLLRELLARVEQPCTS
jgi:hydrogenase maturation protease